MLSISFAATTNNQQALTTTGYHYITARTGQTTTEKIVLTNNSTDAITDIIVENNDPEIIISNDCSKGILAKQTCEIKYSYSPSKDESEDNIGVNAKQSFIKISYQIKNNINSLNFYIVRTHIDSLRIIRIPSSLSNYHHLPSFHISSISYDKNSQTIFAVSQHGLSLSQDYGNTWQTLDLYAATYNKDNLKGVSRSTPYLFYSDANHYYLALRDNDDYDQVKLLISDDYGATWRLGKEMPDIRAIYAKDNLIVMGGNQSGFISHDSGKTWQLISDNTTNITAGVINGKNSIVISSADLSPILRSEDEGYSWTLITRPEHCSYGACLISDISIYNNEIYISVNEYQSFLKKTNDDGKTWVDINSGCSNIEKMTFDANLMLVSNKDHVCISKDQGKSWVTTPSPYAIKLIIDQNQNIILGALEDGFYDNINNNNWNLKKSDFEYPDLNIRDLSGNENNSLFLGIGSYRNNPYALDSGQSIIMIDDDGLKLKKIYTFPHISDNKKFQAKMLSNIIYRENSIDNTWYSDLYSSNDFGQSWVKENNSPINEFAFYNNLKLLVDNSIFTIFYASESMYCDKLYISQDLGKNFNQISTKDLDQPCLGSYYYANNHFYFNINESSISSMNGLYLLSNSNIWTPILLNTEIDNIIFNEDNIYLISKPNDSNPSLLHISHDAGKTWQSNAVPNDSELIGVNSNMIFISTVIDKSILIKSWKLQMSTDEGLTWHNLGMIWSSDTVDWVPQNMFFTKNEIFIASDGLFSIGYPIKK